MKNSYDTLFGDAMRIEDIDFTLVERGAVAPARAHQYDAGNDLFAIESKEIKPGELVKVRTGIAVALPEGTQGIIKDRSSIGSKGLHVFAGVIDSGYTGEISVMLYNANTWLTPDSVLKVIQSGMNVKNVLFGKSRMLEEITKSMHQEYDSKIYKINKGDKIAQLIVSPITVVHWWKKPTLGKTERGSSGFGSSGK
jgi:dUTP pyrophosphatase